MNSPRRWALLLAILPPILPALPATTNTGSRSASAGQVASASWSPTTWRARAGALLRAHATRTPPLTTFPSLPQTQTSTAPLSTSPATPTGYAAVLPTTTTTTTTQVPQTGPQTAMAAEPAWVQQAFACIRWRESRTTPTVVNPVSEDSGLYQFAVTTWLANGGGQFASEARFATPAEQNDVAAWTYNAWGFSPWSGDDACWGG